MIKVAGDTAGCRRILTSLEGENVNPEKRNNIPENGRYSFPKVNFNTSCLVQNCDLGEGRWSVTQKP